MSTHLAIAITGLGVIEEITLPTPSLGPTDVLVETSYSTLIAFDTYTTDFLFGLDKDKDLPVPLSISASGYVKAVGERVGTLKAGDAVCFFLQSVPFTLNH